MKNFLWKPFLEKAIFAITDFEIPPGFLVVRVMKTVVAFWNMTDVYYGRNL